MAGTSALATWAREFGRAELARKLRVTWGAVNNWTSFKQDGTPKSYPRPEYARQIVELSGGRVSLADIYGPQSSAAIPATTTTKG